MFIKCLLYSKCFKQMSPIHLDSLVLLESYRLGNLVSVSNSRKMDLKPYFHQQDLLWFCSGTVPLTWAHWLLDMVAGTYLGQGKRQRKITLKMIMAMIISQRLKQCYPIKIRQPWCNYCGNQWGVSSKRIKSIDRISGHHLTQLLPFWISSQKN